MKKTILIFSLLLASSLSCKKYEEGPWISFRSAYNRILGNWKVISYTVNGVDSMQYIYKHRMDEKWVFKEWGDLHYTVEIAKDIGSGNYQYIYGGNSNDNWNISDNDKTI
jgi:hypothetical protein